MTILTKHILSMKKTPLIPECYGDNEIIDIHCPTSGRKPPKRSSLALVCMSLTAIVVVITGLTSGLMLYRQSQRSPVFHRYHGYCTVPIIPNKMPATDEPNFGVLPLRWSMGSDNDGELRIIKPMDPEDVRNNAKSLHEELDIGNGMEKILVFEENKRHINFIHNFDTNLTGIVDAERCFTMELQPEVSLAPAALALALSRGEQFDVRRVRSSLRAALPALHRLAARALAADLLDLCADRPIYELRKEDQLIIRKRSSDERPHDYIQFAGKYVQEIEINNLAEVLEHEQNKNESDNAFRREHN